MMLPRSDALFDRLACRLRPLPPAGLMVGAGVAMAAAAAGIAFRQFWIGGLLLLAGCLADGLGQAMARRAAVNMMAAMPLMLLLIPFGFALADPARALAAMFLMLSLALFTTQRGLAGRIGPDWVHGLAGAALLLACALPDRFSLLAYLVGIACFAAAGQGLARVMS